MHQATVFAAIHFDALEARRLQTGTNASILVMFLPQLDHLRAFVTANADAYLRSEHAYPSARVIAGPSRHSVAVTGNESGATPMLEVSLMCVEVEEKRATRTKARTDGHEYSIKFAGGQDVIEAIESADYCVERLSQSEEARICLQDGHSGSVAQSIDKHLSRPIESDHIKSQFSQSPRDMSGTTTQVQYSRTVLKAWKKKNTQDFERVLTEPTPMSIVDLREGIVRVCGTGSVHPNRLPSAPNCEAEGRRRQT